MENMTMSKVVYNMDFLAESNNFFYTLMKSFPKHSLYKEKRPF